MGAGDVTLLGQEILAALQVGGRSTRPGAADPNERDRTDGRRADEPDAGSRQSPTEAAGTRRHRRYRRSSDDAEASDLEGPRRRARREREERRAAQARATAIEEARREAKRRVAGRPVRSGRNPLRAA